jgi:hypothetical protein
MIRHPRSKVLRFEYRPNTSPDESSRSIWPRVADAVLECGHIFTRVGLVDREGKHYSPKHVACSECAGARLIVCRTTRLI